MVFIDVGPVVMLTTSHTATTRVLPLYSCQCVFAISRKRDTDVLADTTVAGGNVAAMFAGFGQSVSQALAKQIVIVFAAPTYLVGMLTALWCQCRGRLGLRSPVLPQCVKS